MAKDGDFKAADMPNDLSGYVVIVTGGNSGFGYHTTLELAKRNARVYIASRSRERVEEAIRNLKRATPQTTLDLHFLQLDLQALHSIKAAADEFSRLESRLDILVNNAGIMAVPYQTTTNGFETQWQTNFLGPYAFVKHLLPLLLATAARCDSKNRVRIVNVSSDAAFLGTSKGIHFDDPNLESLTGSFAPWKRYGHSKMASIMHAAHINNLYRSRGISAYSVHPGIAQTNLQAADPTFIGTMVRLTMKLGLGVISAADGARTSLYCATSPDAPQHSGMFLKPYGKLDHRADKWFKDKESLDKLAELADTELDQAGF